MPCTVPIPYQKTLLPNRSSFLLNGYLYWPNSLSKKHLPSKFDLFSANYILFTSPILYQKSSVAPYELFLLITCSLLTPFTAIKALLPHISYFMLITCDWLLLVIIGFILHQKSFVTHWSSSLLIVWLYCPNSLLQQPLSSKFELFYANCMPLLAKFFVKKPLLPECELIFVNYMPFTGRILYRKGFVIQYVPFFANYQPMSWQNSPSKKL